jgi:hypothetical protein
LPLRLSPSGALVTIEPPFRVLNQVEVELSAHGNQVRSPNFRQDKKLLPSTFKCVD